jgi:hypothetical protein
MRHFPAILANHLSPFALAGIHLLSLPVTLTQQMSAREIPGTQPLVILDQGCRTLEPRTMYGVLPCIMYCNIGTEVHEAQCRGM